jgi:hypothetical protein
MAVQWPDAGVISIKGNGHLRTWRNKEKTPSHLWCQIWVIAWSLESEDLPHPTIN